MTAEKASIVMNAEAIAIDQDVTYPPGDLLLNTTNYQVTLSEAYLRESSGIRRFFCSKSAEE